MRDWGECIPRLKADLERIVGDRHPLTAAGHHAATAQSLMDSWSQLGWTVSTQEFAGPVCSGRNLIATRRGTVHPERTWIVGAHYDTVAGSPGADDNGIAIAGLLELARRIREPLQDTVQLVSWDLEEQQGSTGRGLFGSVCMAETWPQSQKLLGVIVLEMIGLCRREPNSQRFPPGFRWLFPRIYHQVKRRRFCGDFLTALIRPNSRLLWKALRNSARQVELPLMTIRVQGPARLLKDFYRSDHAPFWAKGIPAVMLTDTANFRNGQYHTPFDTIDTIDFEFAAQVIQSVHQAILHLAHAVP